ncbi:MAG: hypothetical protein ACK2UN_09785, partial [Candidatus Promineifilaceae bacterium]
FITSFLKRRSNCSGDSPGRASTFGNLNHLLLFKDYCKTFPARARQTALFQHIHKQRSNGRLPLWCLA